MQTKVDQRPCGTIAVTYDTTVDQGYWHALNYRIKFRDVQDGMTPANGVREDYSYSTNRCYVNPDDPYALNCKLQSQILGGRAGVKKLAARYFFRGSYPLPKTFLLYSKPLY